MIAPLVSCIMPTYNRRRFVPGAIAQFLRQDYLSSELVILDDGADLVGDLVPADPSIRDLYGSPREPRREAQCSMRGGARGHRPPLG